MKRKKMIAAVCAAAMVLSMTACSSTQSTTNKEDTVIRAGETDGGTAYTATTVNVGDIVNLDFVKMAITGVEVSEGYSFSVTSTTTAGTTTKTNSSIDCPSGMKLVCVRGKLTNCTSSEIYPSNKPVYGKMYIDGNEYSMDLVCYNTADAEQLTTVVAQQEADMYFYAEVPENVANSISTCDIKFGFIENLDPESVAGIEDLDYIYELEAAPTVSVSSSNNTTVQSSSSTQTPSTTTTTPSTGSGGYILPDSDSRYVTDDELAGLDLVTLRIARNEIYARHGRRFDDSELQAYFDSCSWYHGTISPDSFNESVFNQYEKENITKIKSYETRLSN